MSRAVFASGRCYPDCRIARAGPGCWVYQTSLVLTQAPAANRYYLSLCHTILYPASSQLNRARFLRTFGTTAHLPGSVQLFFMLDQLRALEALQIFWGYVPERKLLINYEVSDKNWSAICYCYGQPALVKRNTAYLYALFWGIAGDKWDVRPFFRAEKRVRLLK